MNSKQAAEKLGIPVPLLTYRLKALGHTWQYNKLDITPEMLEAIKTYRKRTVKETYGVSARKLREWMKCSGLNKKDPRVPKMVELRKTGYYTWKGIRHKLSEQDPDRL